MGFIYGGDTGVSYEDLQRKREIAKMLAQQASSGATTIPQGLTQLGQGIMSAILQGQDKRATKDYNAKFSPVASALLGGKGAAPSSAALPPSVDKKTIASLISDTAKDVGISPEDLATAISYETAGTFDPTKKGPTTKWGQHKGLIQFGEPQAKQYGVDWNDPVNSQLGPGKAVAQYLKAAGVKPGMGMMDVYSAINAGAPGRYGASDAAAGGAPGTVADKVNGQMAGHREKALALLAPSQQEATGMAPQPEMMAGAAPMPPQAGQPPAAPQIVPAGGHPPMAPQPPMTAYQRMMAQGIDKGEAGGLQGRVGQQQMASVMGQGGGINPGILSALGLGGGGAPQAPMAAAPNPNDPAVQQSMGKVAADTNAMSQEQIGQGAEQELAQVPTEQLIALFNDPRANPQQRAFLQSMIEKRMQEQDPTYQMGLEKQRLELEALKNPKPDKPETKEVGGRVVEKQSDGSWKEVYAAPEKPAEPKTQVIELPDGRKIPVDMNNPPEWAKQYMATGQLPPEMAGANGGKMPPKPDDVLKFRKDFNNQPGVSRINEIAPTLQSMYRSIGDPSAMSDLNFVYGLAKILDPDSVVRESESGLVIASQGIVPQMLGELNKFASGEQAMSRESRMNLFNVALSRAKELQKQAQGEYGDYEVMMQDQGIDTGKYLPEVPSIPSWKPKQDQPQPPAGMVPQKAGAAPAVPAAPQQPKEGERKYPFNPKDPASWVKGDVVLGKRFLGGDRRDPKNWVKVE